MDKKNELKIGSWGLVILYIVICSILGILFRAIFTAIISPIIATIVVNTNSATTFLQIMSDKSLNISCILTSIITIVNTAIYWIIVKKFITTDRLTIEKFIKNMIITLTLLTISSIVLNLYKGYNSIYTNLFTLHVACNIAEDEYKEDPEHFEGTGFAEGCKSWGDIMEAEKNTLNDWIAHYFIEPIIPKCVNLLVSITALEIFSHVSKSRIKMLFNFVIGKNQKN